MIAGDPKTELGGSTPTDKAMKHVMDALTAGVQVQGPDQKAMSRVYVILATDGAPNDICVGGAGGDGSAQRQGVIQAVDSGAAVGITTWPAAVRSDHSTPQTLPFHSELAAARPSSLQPSISCLGAVWFQRPDYKRDVVGRASTERAPKTKLGF